MAIIAKPDEQQTETMNTLSPQQQQEEDNKKTQSGSSGESSQIGNDPNTIPQVKAPSSGIFTNLNKFFSANQGAGQKIAGTITGKAQSQAATTGQAITDKLGEYQQKAQKAGEQIKQSQATGQGIIQGINQGQTNLTPDQIAQYQAAAKGRTIAGTGLTDIGGLGADSAVKQIQAFQQQTSQASTPSGTFNLLKTYFDKPQRQYKSGSQALDTAFLRSSPEAKTNMTTALKGVTTDLSGKYGAAEKEAGARMQDLSSASQTLQDTLEKERSSADAAIKAQVDQRTKMMMDQKARAIDEVNKASVSGNLSDISEEVAKALGINRNLTKDNYTDEIQKALSDKFISDKEKASLETSGGLLIDPSYMKNFLTGSTTMGENEIRSRMATAEDLAKAKALASLAGTSQNLLIDEANVGKGLGGEYGGMTYDESKAGYEKGKSITDTYNTTAGAYELAQGAAYINDMVNEGRMTPEQASYYLATDKMRTANPNDPDPVIRDLGRVVNASFSGSAGNYQGPDFGLWNKYKYAAMDQIKRQRQMAILLNKVKGTPQGDQRALERMSWGPGARI